MTLTGRFGPVDSMADFLSPLLSVKFNHELKTNGRNEKAAFQKVLKDFKQSYSWLSSVRMDTYKDGKPKHNQDEHALPFLFMLLFGGGIASVPFKNPYEHSEIAEYWKTYVQLVAKEDRNDEEDKKMKDALESVEAHMSTITESGGDPLFYTKVTDIISLVLNILRKKGGQYAANLLVQNLFNLNYYGLYLSETDFNQWKSNLMFIKMVEVDRQIHFTPWITLIERYMDAAEASLLECMTSSSSSVAAKATASARTKTAFEGAKDLVKKRKRRFRNVEFGADDYVTTIESKSEKH